MKNENTKENVCSHIWINIPHTFKICVLFSYCSLFNKTKAQLTKFHHGSLKCEVLKTAQAHTSASFIQYLDQHDVIFEYVPPNKWPAHSPDLNPCDYSVWAELEKSLHRRNTFSNLEEMKAHLVQVWNNMPQIHIDNTINAFSRRCRLVIEAKGGNNVHFR